VVNPALTHYLVSIVVQNDDEALASHLQRDLDSEVYDRVFYLDANDTIDHPESAGVHDPVAIQNAYHAARFYPAIDEKTLIAKKGPFPLRKATVTLLPALRSGRPRASLRVDSWQSGKWLTVLNPEEYDCPLPPSEHNFETGMQTFKPEDWIAFLRTALVKTALKM